SLYCSDSTNAFGGAALLVHKSISHSNKTLSPDFEATCVTINSKRKIYLICTYISPTKQFNIKNLENVLTPTS
ncbi:hypothetical protein KR200_007157, partial [Drosophila serrata]